MTTLNEELRDLERLVNDKLTDIGKRHQVRSITGEVLSSNCLTQDVRRKYEYYEVADVRLKLTAEV